MIGYHFLRSDMTSPYEPDRPWAVGEKRTLRGGEIEPCFRGYHASPTPWAALVYAPGPVLCRVELSGRRIYSHGWPVDKYAARSRALLVAVDVSRELRLFAADCAKRVLPLFEERYPDDPRPRQAIQAAREFAERRSIAADQLHNLRHAYATADDAAIAVAADRAACVAAFAAAAAAIATAHDAALAASTAAYQVSPAAAERDWQRRKFNRRMVAVIDSADTTL